MRLRITLLLLAVALCPRPSWSQAAAEYGLAAGKSAGATAGAASVLNRANRRLTQSVGQKTANATASSRSQAQPLSARPAAQALPAAKPAAIAGAGAGPQSASNSALVIDTGKETIKMGEGSVSSTGGKAAATKPGPRPAKRYESVISLPAKP